MNSNFKNSIDIKDFNKVLVEAVKRTTYTKEDLDDIDRKTDDLYYRILLKRYIEDIEKNDVRSNEVLGYKTDTVSHLDNLFNVNKCIISNEYHEKKKLVKVSFFL